MTILYLEKILLKKIICVCFAIKYSRIWVEEMGGQELREGYILCILFL